MSPPVATWTQTSSCEPSSPTWIPPDRETGVSPAQVIFGNPIRDFLPIKPGMYQPRQEWRLTREKREPALTRRHARQEQLLSEHTKTLVPLKVSDAVSIQNQHEVGQVWQGGGGDAVRPVKDQNGRSGKNFSQLWRKLSHSTTFTRTDVTTACISSRPPQRPRCSGHPPSQPRAPLSQTVRVGSPSSDGPTEGCHAQQAPDAGHEDASRPPDAAPAWQPSHGDQPAVPPPVHRPTRTGQWGGFVWWGRQVT